ncbi:MAG TPA: adenylyltransferase/cytidyltransferase family protein [Candidatus Nanoarchaeia archaeon]|nr:adenylyltransferase/cytidyltransferase family protein [Candidatus Nanoarchaeia archaeon]
MKTIMCFGTFDLLHLGHLNYFQQAKRYGDYLVVVIARDKTKIAQKKEVIFSERERLELVKNLRVVDEAVLGYPDDHFRIIEEKRPDIIFLGYDHKIDERVLAKKLMERGLSPVIKRAKPFKIGKHKSTLLREKVLQS